MYKLMIFAGIAFCFGACNSANNKESAETKKEDNPSAYWVSLFDGKTLPAGTRMVMKNWYGK